MRARWTRGGRCSPPISSHCRSNRISSANASGPCCTFRVEPEDAVVLMDGDLQDEPEIIPELVRHHQAGAEVVYARRVSRPEGLLRRATYKLFYRIVSSLAEVELPLDSGDFALLGSRVVTAL